MALELPENLLKRAADVHGTQGKPVPRSASSALKNAKDWFGDFRLAINARAGGGHRIPTFRESIPNLAPVALLIWLFAGHEIYQRAEVALNGTVVSSETGCLQPYNNRCDTTYIVESQNHVRSTYVAGPTDAPLGRRLPVGTLIQKDKWALTYSVNGKIVNDFPINFYGGLMLFGLVCALFGRPSSRKPI